jgi:hypothetical protein
MFDEVLLNSICEKKHEDCTAEEGDIADDDFFVHLIDFDNFAYNDAIFSLM